ncbi:Acyl-CoA desaturase [Blattella germanica]|nr:Acyl-CoA desaturase [Blattella germanica]
MSSSTANGAVDSNGIKHHVANGINGKEANGKTVSDQEVKQGFVWRNIIFFIYLHLGAVYGLYTMMAWSMLPVFVFQVFYNTLGGIGITAGAHRLWAHRSYKAKLPLRIILAFFQTLAFQNHIYEWSRDHRVHHKFTETDADPHNAKRGFFFSHVGWLLMRKHPDVFIKGKTVDMSDLERDSVVVWQRRIYPVAMPILRFVVPTVLPMYIWDIDFWPAWYQALSGWALSLNFTWLVNSAAHMWGFRPYDKTLNPAENKIVAALAYGEGWHNYHHTFPYDYKAAELGNYSYNLTTAFIDFFAALGWAYDLKTVPESVVKRRVARTGDGSHPRFGSNTEGKDNHQHSENMPIIWGWGDKDMKECDMKDVTMISEKKSE